MRIAPPSEGHPCPAPIRGPKSWEPESLHVTLVKDVLESAEVGDPVGRAITPSNVPQRIARIGSETETSPSPRDKQRPRMLRPAEQRLPLAKYRTGRLCAAFHF